MRFGQIFDEQMIQNDYAILSSSKISALVIRPVSMIVSF
jgi:hypothetical protein